ncbi:type II toxin-antitoxin system VapC family toxin [Cereibacter sphaeroides]|uniref:type II toxin-antitoxin system VapC family toxin n=1 Tax=Cereibacter sphaeroides TaxID=1063 RepID=UPI000F541E7D|nr:hypothetical protein [Cereibacter sphaeroides]
MIAAIDNTFFTLMVNPSALARPNPNTGLPTPHVRERIESLIDDLSKSGSQLLVPTPALAETLCISGSADRLLEQLSGYSCIETVGFDKRAAFEFSEIIRSAKNNGDKRCGVAGKWQYLKIDYQIVAIAKVNGATVFYSDDDGQSRFAELAGMQVVHTWNLPLSPARAQILIEGAAEWPEQQKPLNPAR